MGHPKIEPVGTGTRCGSREAAFFIGRQVSFKIASIEVGGAPFPPLLREVGPIHSPSGFNVHPSQTLLGGWTHSGEVYLGRSTPHPSGVPVDDQDVVRWGVPHFSLFLREVGPFTALRLTRKFVNKCAATAGGFFALKS